MLAYPDRATATCSNDYRNRLIRWHSRSDRPHLDHTVLSGESQVHPDGPVSRRLRPAIRWRRLPRDEFYRIGDANEREPTVQSGSLCPGLKCGEGDALGSLSNCQHKNVVGPAWLKPYKSKAVPFCEMDSIDVL